MGGQREGNLKPPSNTMRSQSIWCQVDKPRRKITSFRNTDDMDKSWKHWLPDRNGEGERSEGMEAGDCCLLAHAFKHHLIFKICSWIKLQINKIKCQNTQDVRLWVRQFTWNAYTDPFLLVNSVLFIPMGFSLWAPPVTLDAD